ncbi:MAG: 2-C-methyl-D-erythritol 4-phosphate cytidylyltransferase [Bacteroidetes bacterium]|nr:MAG: 2-C-methyl-D-erythritol 4-phosphate cytidylyltransferase [Bacteroidota bacterium]
MNKIGVIIVAGGSGSRMKSNTPKQFIAINGKPLLQYTIDRFFNWNPNIDLVLVLPETEINTWKNLVTKNKYSMNYRICEGGKERFDSVKNGLELLENDLIMIHDGVRPFVSNPTLDRCLETTNTSGSAIPVIPLVESIRKITPDGSQPVDRESLRLVQTPQCFKNEWIKKAYQQSYSVDFTDDASVVQKAGYSINLINGNRENIKITTPDDLKLAEYYFSK